MSYATRVRRSGKRLVRHFGADLLVTLERLTVQRDSMAGEQRPTAVETYAGVPACQVSRQANDREGATRHAAVLLIAGAAIPGAALDEGRWTLTLPDGQAFVIPRPVRVGDPSAGAPAMWEVQRVEGAA